MSKIDWTDKLRDQLADYHVPASDDLWTGIENALAQHDSGAGKMLGISTPTKRQVWIRRFSMAAAIAALAVGGSYIYLHPWGDVEPSVAERQLTPASVGTTQQPSVFSSLVNKVKSVMRTDAKPSESCVAMSSEEARVAALTVEDAMQQPVAQEAEQPQVQEKKQVASKVAEARKAKTNTYSDAFALGASPVYPSQKKAKSSLSLKVYGENGFNGGNAASMNMPYMTSSSPSNDVPAYNGDCWNFENELDAKVLYGLRDMQYREKAEHHFPLTIGVQVGVPITSKWMLSVGLDYIRTSSDFSGEANGSSTTTTQVLHYVGIPLNVSYSIWRNSHFRTYVSAGGEGALNVKNDTESNGEETFSKKDRMQWSVNAAVGAQYDFLPQLGVYVEPGVKYYFDNGSSIENYFKDKKTNFNLQFGLRWTIE